jgi:hypothetical protein
VKLTRRRFLQDCAVAAPALATGWTAATSPASAQPPISPLPTMPRSLLTRPQPLAFTMWDFSWLERRWSGAGYEDWDHALGALVERGYNAVRIDAYPHFVADAPLRARELLPVWTVHEWGSPGRISVQVQPALQEFILRCGAHGIQVGLSTWFRQDVDNLRLQITTPAAHAALWIATVAELRRSGALEHVCYVDLCNEFPGESWAPFFDNSPDSSWNGTTDKSLAWCEAAVAAFRSAEPDLPVTVSISGFNPQVRERWSFLDFLEPHIWMTQSSDFFDRIGGNYNNFDFTAYDALAARGAALYRASPAQWQAALRERINAWADISRACGRPLVTTECWAVVNYRDWPGLEWDWIKELCEYGVEQALATGRWVGVATSNFCGPQFVGMWRDIAWHRRVTDRIRNSPTSLG